VFINVKT